MTTDNDAIVKGPAFVVGGGGDSGFATEVTPLVTITVSEYRELCGKAALWDSYSADAERWASGGDE